jgi:hypothetical protein
MVLPALSLLTLLVSSQLDSATLSRRARAAQAAFEGARRVRLPTVLGGAGGECDLRIGRFCYWYDPGARPPPPEPSSIGTARERLIRVLDSVAARIPGDDWVAGQRVRYLMEAGRTDDAVGAARHCRGTPWWCAALEGLARHVAGDYGVADSVFRVALGQMPLSERCRWTDLTPLLEAPLRGRYRRLDCDARQALNARIWWLARPLLAPVGNDRRTEHYARLTMARMWRDAASPFSMRGDDVTELIMRYGWPRAWSQTLTSSVVADRTVIGSEREPSYHFLPESLVAPGAVMEGDLPLARERYAPAYADTFVFFDPELSAFRRGESTLVVAVYDLTGDALFRDVRRDAALVLGHDEEAPPVVVRRPEAPIAGVLVATAPWMAHLSSLEIIASSERRAAVGRRALRTLRPIRGRVVVSDLLAFEPQDSLPANLAATVPHTRTLLHVPGGSRVGLYWEVYGLAPGGEVLATSVSVAPERVGWLRRVVGAVGLARRPRRVEIEWQETGLPLDGLSPRALVVDLSTLPPGEYRITVRVRAHGTDAAFATRQLRIVPP